MTTLAKRIKHHKSSGMVEHYNWKDYTLDFFVIIMCVLVAFCSLVPMWYVLMCSLSDGQTLLEHEGMVWWPVGKVTLDGYRHIFESNGSIFDNEILKGYFNTILYTVTATALGFFISVTGGYAMSRQTKLRKFMTVFVMITMMFGGGLIPTYMVIRSLGWVNTRWAVIVPGCTNAMFIIMMMNAFMMVPQEMYEAATIDGANHFTVLFRIVLPQAMNMGAVILLNSIVGQWNSWFQASIYLTSTAAREYWPLQLFIKELTANNTNFLQTSNPDYSRYLIQYAAIVSSILPIVILFPFFQDKLEKGVIGGGVKG